MQTGHTRDVVNGILFSTVQDDIDALAQREYGYDLVPVDYEQGGEQSSAYMFIARKTSEAIGHRVRDDILPNESSLSTCISGAATYGIDFMETWLRSCYLANGTPLMEDAHFTTLALEFVQRSEHLIDG